jgi:hypothetical protein
MSGDNTKEDMMRLYAKNIPVVCAINFLLLILFAFSGRTYADDSSERGLSVVPNSQRWAILVGVNDYDDVRIRDLHYAVADVTKLRDKLIDIGFSRERVECLTTGDEVNSPTKNNIENRIQTVAEKAGEGDLIIFVASYRSAI